MNVKRLLGIACVLTALALPVSGAAAEDTDDLSVYFRPAVRFGTDDRTITSFDLLVPFWQGDKSILFFNPRYSLDDRDGSEVNFGFGYRHLLFSDEVILGVNGYYDCRWTGWGTRHEQVGLGAEVMTDWVTGRFNGYFAVTGPRIGAVGSPGNAYTFRDVGIYFDGGAVEETLSGFDGELGFKVPYLSDYMETWVYAGGYHFSGDYVDDVNGFSSRIEVVPTDFLRFGFAYRNDNLSGDEYYGEAAVTVPFSVDNLVKGKNPFAGIRSHLGGDRTLRERLVEPVRRDIDVRVGREGNNTSVPGVGSLVEDVVFVSENAENIAGTRDGTFEHPYESIGEAMNDGASGVLSGVRTVHVMDDGGAYAGGGTVGVSGLTIWGSGMAHPVYGVIINQYLTAPDIYEIDVTAGGVEIFGGNFVDAYGIVSGGAGTNIHDNTFTGTCGVYGTGGSSTVTDNDFLGNAFGIYAGGGTVTITDNTIGTAASPITNTGIYAGGGATLNPVTGNTIVVSGTGNAYGIRSYITDLILSNNAITVTSTGGIAYGIYERVFSGDIFGSIAGGSVTADGNRAYGVYLDAFDGSIGGMADPFAISGLAVDATGSAGNAYGIYEYAYYGDIFGTIAGGSVTAAGGTAYGVYLEVDDGSIGGTADPFAISGLTVDATGSAGNAYGIYECAYNGDIFGTIAGGSVTAAGDTAYGIYERVSSGDIFGSIAGGSVTAAGDTAYGVYLETPGFIGGMAHPFAISDLAVDATGMGGDAYGIYEYSSEIFGTITNGSVTAAGDANAYGVYVVSGFVGSPFDPFTVSGVSASITGSVAQYLLYLSISAAGAGNGVDWTGNTYGGSAGWSGNYLDAATTPLGATVLPAGTYPVWTNFLTGDYLNP